MANVVLAMVACWIVLVVSLAPLWRYVMLPIRLSERRVAGLGQIAAYLYFGLIGAEAARLDARQKRFRLGLNLFINFCIYVTALIVYFVIKQNLR